MRIIAIDSFDKGWVISYEVLVPCGCYFDRKILYTQQENKPTIEEATQLVDESNN